MSRLHTSEGYDTAQPIDVAVPVLAIEDDVNSATLDVHELSVPDPEANDQPKSADPISLDEMLFAQREDMECQHYSSTIDLPSCRFDFDNDGLLVRHSPLDGAVQTVVPAVLRERIITLSHSPLMQGYPGK